MRVAVDSLPQEGMDVTFGPNTAWAAASVSGAFEAPVSELGGALHVLRQAQAVHVRGSLRGEATRTCERCGDPVSVVIDAPVDLVYVPADHGTGVTGEIRLGQSDLDVGWYEDGILDLADVLSEATALALPPRIQCADEAACDARVAALLAAAGSAGSPTANPFATLRQLL